MKLFFNILFLITCTGTILVAQTYSGPAEGSVLSGVIVSTDDFLRVAPISEPKERGIRNVHKNLDDQTIVPPRFTNSNEGDNFTVDPSVLKQGTLYDTAMAVVLKSFNGLPETNSIPPDPYIAVGPTHVMATVNSSFAIWDKEGNLIKTINADLWYRPLYSLASAFDPKVLYDHFAKRWIMVWLHQNDNTMLSYYFVSVSDDSIPTGTWYSWALPSNLNGNTAVNNWGDYQGVGFDDKAIYLSSNQFSFGSPAYFQYTKIRIIPKAQLYANTAGPAVWKDIWNIRYPTGGPASMVFNIRPSIMYSANNEYYLLHAPNFGSGQDFMALYKIKDVLTNPSLTGSIVPVTFSYPAPKADQLGGSTMLIEAGGSNIRNEPKYRDGYLWGVHSIRNPSSTSSSSLRYVKIDVQTSTASEDMAMGAPNYWYAYPALEVDQDHNLAVTFSRSATTEYMGAFFSYRIATDPPGLRGSIMLQDGKANYVKDYGSERNRWGDYNGLWLDPSDNYSMWTFTEYVAALNTWGTWVGKIRLTPFSGIYAGISPSILQFGNIELNNTSDTLKLQLSNYGDQDLVINSMPGSDGPFSLLNNLTFPYVIETYDTLTLNFLFAPSDTGAYDINYPVSSNDPEFTGISLSGYSYQILPSPDNTLYAVSGSLGNSASFTLNTQTGAGTVLGPTKIKDLKSICINPKNSLIYGISTDNHIVRVNAEKGDGYNLFNTNLQDVFGAAFDTSGQLYCVQRTGEIYSVDLEAQSLTMVSQASITISDIAFNPVTNELWASLYLPIGANKDRIFKIDLLTGDTTLVGRTGFNNMIPALTFDASGNLYSISGTSSQLNNLIKVDTSTGAGTLIGSIGVKDITGLAYSPGQPVNVEDGTTQLPSEYSLRQNYPNPFNPSTSIEFSLPESAEVKMIIYNLLGETVDVVLNSALKAGVHKLNWNTSGKNLSSGIYFYEIRAKAANGKLYSSIRKMILMK